MLSVNGSTRFYVCERATDMRRSFEGLSYLVREVIREDPLSGHCFIFFNRVRDKVKVLYFDRTGFAIWYNCLSSYYTSFSYRRVSCGLVSVGKSMPSTWLFDWWVETRVFI